MNNIDEIVRDYIKYDPKLGTLRWKKSDGKIVKGKLCGSSCNGYRRLTLKGRILMGHRVAWFLYYGEWPEGNIDHIDTNRWNNRITNLRVCTQAENTKNRRLNKNNNSGISGVSWSKTKMCWRVRIGFDNNRIEIGNYKDFFEACCARKAAEITYGYNS